MHEGATGNILTVHLQLNCGRLAKSSVVIWNFTYLDHVSSDMRLLFAYWRYSGWKLWKRWISVPFRNQKSIPSCSKYNIWKNKLSRFVVHIMGEKLESFFVILVFVGCTAKKVWMLVRHGTRNPNSKLIEKFSTRLADIRDLILENNPQPNGNYTKCFDNYSSLNVRVFIFL